MTCDPRDPNHLVGEYPRAEQGPVPEKSGQTGTFAFMASMVPLTGDER